MIKKKAHVPRRVKLQEKNIEIPARLKKQNYEYYNVKHTMKRLGINKDFLIKINENTRVLEIGSGSGRFADFLLRKTKLKPENLELMDLQFKKEDLPYLKSLVYRLQNKGKIKLTQGDLFTHDYKGKFYDIVLIPNSFFSFVTLQNKLEREKFKEIIIRKYKRIINKFTITEIKKIESLNIFLKRIDPAIKINGEIRINYFPERILKLVKEAKENKIFSKYDFEIIHSPEINDSTLVVKKRKK
jgi:SAM-dependent methyltransferase